MIGSISFFSEFVKDFQRTLQTACQNYQNGASAAQAVQPAAYFHFSTGTAGQESRNNPGLSFYLKMIFMKMISVQFENADLMAGFTQRGGVFTVPYDGVYEFGVSLRLDVSFKSEFHGPIGLRLLRGIEEVIFVSSDHESLVRIGLVSNSLQPSTQESKNRLVYAPLGALFIGFY